MYATQSSSNIVLEDVCIPPTLPPKKQQQKNKNKNKMFLYIVTERYVILGYTFLNNNNKSNWMSVYSLYNEFFSLTF